MNITINENLAVQKTAYNLKKFMEDIGTRDKIIEDIAGLKTEIIDETGFMFPMFICYICLLEKEQYKHDPIYAFLAGKESKAIGEDCTYGFLKYMNRVELSPEAQKLGNDMQKCYDMLILLLAEKRGLINEFTELYRQVYGGINYHINGFFTMGFKSL